MVRNFSELKLSVHKLTRKLLSASSGYMLEKPYSNYSSAMIFKDFRFFFPKICNLTPPPYNYVQKSCAGQDAGAEAAIHAMIDIFADIDADAVLLIDAENTFDSINRKVMTHNLKFICSIIATNIINCYAIPSMLFNVDGGEILSSEETTPGEPTADGAYALGILPFNKISA